MAEKKERKKGAPCLHSFLAFDGQTRWWKRKRNLIWGNIVDCTPNRGPAKMPILKFVSGNSCLTHLPLSLLTDSRAELTSSSAERTFLAPVPSSLQLREKWERKNTPSPPNNWTWLKSQGGKITRWSSARLCLSECVLLFRLLRSYWYAGDVQNFFN